MPNRYVREAAIQSERVNSVGWQAEVFWRRLLNRVDDFGRCKATPALLRASIFPLQLDRVRDSDISRLLAECEKSGLLYVYVVAEKPYLVLNQWEKGRAASSAHPPPPDEVCERMQTFVYNRKHPPANAPDSDSDSNTDTDSDLTVFPAALDNPEFKAKWGEYTAYRREQRFKPLKARSIAKQFEEMESWGVASAIQSIDDTIRNSWQGLFAPKNGRPAPKPKSELVASVPANLR